MWVENGGGDGGTKIGATPFLVELEGFLRECEKVMVVRPLECQRLRDVEKEK